VIIDGGGPAGLAAGLYCYRAALTTVLIEKGLLGGQIAISKDVENYPGLEGITGFDLAEKLVHQVQTFGLNIIQQEVAAVNTGADRHSVRLVNGELLQATALILALGGTARKLGIPGEKEYLGSGVSYCGTCDGFFFRDKTVVVVGGGDTAVEEALYLSRLAKKVLLVHRSNVLRANKLLQTRLKAEPAIEVIWNTIITAIMGNGKVVESVSIENIETGERGELPTDGVFIFIGYSPNNQLIPPTVRINELGFVLTGDRCETSVPGIFAVGDVRHGSVKRVASGVGEGSVAVQFIHQYLCKV
jgi:thioredoxin reductase (NADPH)